MRVKNILVENSKELLLWFAMDIRELIKLLESDGIYLPRAIISIMEKIIRDQACLNI